MGLTHAHKAEISESPSCRKEGGFARLSKRSGRSCTPARQNNLLTVIEFLIEFVQFRKRVDSTIKLSVRKEE